ncbi:MAG: ferrochelatase [Burkholderiaceae bacterium]|nr:ferrochelatase [Burkholderiaceae bacterium]
MPFAPEPVHEHGKPSSPDTAVLLCNLGTPDAPTAQALRRYLKEFLSDPRVVEIPRLLWWFILNGVILQVRPKQSAAKYASIWTDQGSPLKVWTEKQAAMLQGYLGERGHRVLVRPAMRYGSPAIATALDELRSAGITRVLVLPLYPQYSGPTTASVCDAVFAWGKRARRLPEFRFVNQYHDDPAYISALAKRVSDQWKQSGRPEKLVLSFHGVPRRTLMLGDPYHCQCLKTARLLGERLGLGQDELVVTFQSRFGKAEWLQPYTEPTLIALAKQGIKRVDIMCPGFTADCLETLEEIAEKARTAFLNAGGTQFNYLPCLNDQHEWLVALSSIAINHLQGWDCNVIDDATARAAQRERALALGADR